jgi:glycosyltransferase involved in cell wall biosynthesis
MKSPKVSILMAVYNEETYLSEAIDSILKQSFKDYEIIIIDDASNDRTLEIAREYEKKHENIRVLFHKENKRKAAALNLGLTVAKGELIAFLDGDDLYLKDKLAEQVKFMDENKDVDLVYSDMRRFYPDGRTEDVKSLKIKEDLRTALKKSMKREDLGTVKPYMLLLDGQEKQLITSCSVMVRKKVFEKVKYDERAITAQDYDMWFQIIGAGFKLAHLPKLHYLYRMHENQITKNEEAKLIGLKLINEKLKRGVYFK